MYTKQNFIDSIKNEHRIMRHLFTKIPESVLEYRPTAGQRSGLELLQYMSIVTLGAVSAVVKNDTKVYAPLVEVAKSVTKDSFLEMFDKNEQEALALLESMTDEDLNQVVNLYNMGEKTKGVYFVETILKWLPAYKMQLFLYIKACGNTSIGTSNLWGGMDMPPAQM